jgi:hypothetical protein
MFGVRLRGEMWPWIRLGSKVGSILLKDVLALLESGLHLVSTGEPWLFLAWN